MKKNELIDRVTREARLRRSEAVRAVKAVVGSIRATISEGGKISLSGLGTFKVKSRKARPGRNPKTGETIQIPDRSEDFFQTQFGFEEADQIAGHGISHQVSANMF